MYYTAEQWEYVGLCKYCNSPCYTKDGEFRGTSTDPDCICSVEKEDKDSNCNIQQGE